MSRVLPLVASLVVLMGLSAASPGAARAEEWLLWPSPFGGTEVIDQEQDVDQHGNFTVRPRADRWLPPLDVNADWFRKYCSASSTASVTSSSNARSSAANALVPRTLNVSASNVFRSDFTIFIR